MIRYFDRSPFQGALTTAAVFLSPGAVGIPPPMVRHAPQVSIVPAGQIRPGDAILALGGPKKVTRVEPGPMPKTVRITWGADGFVHHVDTPIMRQ